MTIDIEAKVLALAAALGLSAHRGARWFDGFWDFVVEHRLELDTAWEIQGPGWAFILFPPSAAGDPLRAHVFVEARDRRAGVRVPWPVSSLALEHGARLQTHARDPHGRPFDLDAAARVGAFGFELEVGYWGVRASRSFDLPEHGAFVESLFAELPRIVGACRNLALTLA